MAKRLLLFTGFFLYAYLSFGQLPPPCPSNSTPPSDICNQTCIYCNFNGMQSSTAGYTSQTPAGFCGSIENEQWLGFIAGETGATFTALPSNCTNGDGIQVAVYSACSGSPLGCYGGMGGGGMTPATVSITGMVPGQNYFFMIDGFAGDQCDFTIVASPPSAITPPIPAAPTMLDGPTKVCPNAVVEYCVPVIPGAAGYTWVAPGDALINGMPPPATILSTDGGECVTITFGSQSGVICVNGANSCFTGPPLCQPVVVAPIPPTQLPDTAICQQDLPYVTSWGQSVMSTGVYDANLVTDIGCDSVVRQFVFVKIPIPTVIPPTTLCPGEVLSVCGVDYSDQGNYQALCTGSDGCDSTVNFAIITPMLSANITGASNIDCITPTATLSYDPSPGTPTWYDLNQFNSIGNGTTQTITQPGTYILDLAFTVGSGTCSAFDTVVITGNVTPPTVLTTGGTVGCGTTTQISATSNAPNATFMWSGGATPATSATPTVSAPGTYSVTVTNPDNGCTNENTAVVMGSTDAPVIAMAGNDIDCSVTTANLMANVTNVAPATPTYAWSSGGSTTADLSVTAPGSYTVTVTNPDNQCTSIGSFTVNQNIQDPDATVSPGGTLDCVNTTTDITAASQTAGATYAWGTSTNAVLTVSTAGSYTVTVTDPANGCTNTASTTVTEDIAPPGAATAGGTLTCDISSLPLTATTSATTPTFDWGNGNTNATLQVSTSGNYVVTVTGLNGCTSTATATVDDDFVAPTASATGGTITCSQSCTTIDGTSGTGNATFEWTGPSGGVITGASPSVCEPGTYTLVVTNPDNGCTAETTADVMPDAGIPDAAATGGTLDCNNPSITINGSSTTVGVTMSWVSPSGAALTGTSPTVNEPGDYILTVEDPSNGCTITATTTVDQDIATPGFSISGGTLTCTATDLELQLVPNLGQNANGWTYSWDGPTGALPTVQNPTVSQPGLYTVTVTGPNGCTQDGSQGVTADTGIPQIATAADVLTCAITTVQINTDITLGAGSSVTNIDWTGPNGFTNTMEDPMVSDSGSYVVVVTADNGCTSSATYIVDQDTVEPDVLADGGIIGCAVQSVDLMSTSQVGTGFAWTGPNGFTSMNPNPNVSVDGDYTLTVTGPNGCTASDIATVSTDYDSASVAIAPPLTLTCDNGVISLDLTATSTSVPVSDYLWSASNGYTSTAEDPDDITEPGTYVVVVTTANSCTSTETIVVDQNIVEPGASAVDNTVTCVVTSVPLMASSPTAGVTYSWEDPNGGTSLMGASPTVTIPGIYNITVTDPSNGCTSTTSAELLLDGDFPVDVAIAAPIATITCDNPQLTLTGSSSTAGVEYEWFDVNGNSLGTDANLVVTMPGDYSLSVTDPTNGCVTPDATIVDINTTPPDLTAVGGTVDCQSGQVMLDGGSTVVGAIFTWEDANGNIYTVEDPTVSNTGMYTLIVEDPVNGCTATEMTEVFENTDAPVVALSPTDVLDCVTPSVTITGTITSPSTATYEWQDATGSVVGTDLMLSITTPGTYTFVVIDPANGCRTAPESIIMQDLVEPGVTATDNLITCANPMVDIEATSIPTATFEWTDPNTGSPLVGGVQNVNAPGVYTVIATDPNNGCTSMTSSNVTQDIAAPALTLTGDVITCATPTIVLDSESPVANLDYSWTGGLPAVEDPTVDVAGMYTLTITNPVNGCTSEETYDVMENVAPPAGVSATNEILTCILNSIGVEASSTTPGVTYEWFDENGNSVGTGATYDATSAQIYSVVITDPSNGCTAETTSTVQPDANAPAVFATGGLINCMTPTVDLTGSSTTANTTLQWTGPNGFTSTDANPNVDAEGQYTLTVTSSDNGCTADETVEVDGNFQAPSVDIIPPAEIDCNNASVIVTANGTGQGTISYDWSSLSGSILNGSTTNNPEVGAGTYTVVITDSSNGCTSEEEVTVNADPATPAGADDVLRNISCFGETDGAVIVQGVQGGTPPFMYSFNGSAFSAQSQWTFLAPGSYPMTIQDALGCEWSTVYEIVEPEELFIDLGQDLTLELGDSISIDNDMVINFPDRVEQFVVEPLDFYPFICDTCTAGYYKAFYTSRYEVTILDSNGCKAVDDRLIIVDRTRNVYVPNVFNPDAPDINALLTVYGNTKHVTNIKSFKLYDRWGELVHEAYDFPPNNYDQAWDGRYQEKRMNPSVLVWVAEVEFVDGLIELYKGDVTVVGN